MPHHPSGGGEVEETVAGFDVAVEDVLLFVLDEGPGGGVDDAFWSAGSARGVQDIERMRWW